MASNVPQALATEEAQGPQEAIMDCVAFLYEEGKGGSLLRFCGFAVLDDFSGYGFAVSKRTPVPPSSRVDLAVCYGPQFNSFWLHQETEKEAFQLDLAYLKTEDFADPSDMLDKFHRGT